MKRPVLKGHGFKLLIASLLPLLTVSVANSQINFTYVTNVITYAPNSGGTVIIPASTDEAVSSAQNIGFNFTYNCTTYTQFVASSNGWMSLGAAATQPLPTNALGTTGIGPILAPLWDNLSTDAAGNVNYLLTGTPGSRILTVEWLNMHWDPTSTTAVMSFQVKLHEGTNQIEFVYTRVAGGSIANGSASIGLSGGSIATDFYSLNAASAGTAVYDSETNNLKKKPVGNRSFLWTAQNNAYLSSTVTQLATGLISACTPSQAIIGVQVATNGCTSPISLTQLQLNMNGSTIPGTNTNDVKKIHIYYTGSSPAYSPTGEFVSGGITPATGTITANSSQTLAPGINYFWIAYDVNIGSATAGNTIDAECTQLTVGGVAQTPTVTAPAGAGTFSSCSVSPGGISGEAFWIKTTNGVPTTTDGVSIASWNDQSGNVRNASSLSGHNPVYHDNSTNNINFNPVVDFNDASQQYLTIAANGLLATGNNAYSVYAVIRPGADNLSTPGKFLFGGTAGTDTYSAFGIGSTNSYVDSWSSDDLAVNNAWTVGAPSLSGFSYDGTTRSLYAGGSLAGTLAGGTRSSADVNDAIGARNDAGASEFFNGSIAEIVTYPNTAHSAAARNKIETYLGIKYGITLQHNYVSASGTTVWNRSTDAAFNTNITGIGRDDNSNLVQKEGKSSDATPDMLTVYIGPSKTVNQSANTGAFASGDQSFFMVANNNAAFQYANSSSTSQQPATVSSRLLREWLAQKTNFTNTDLTLEFDFNVITPGYSAPLNAADLRLLLNSTSDMSTATIGAATITVSGAVVTVIIPASSFSSATYFTLASVSSTTDLPVVLTGFNAACRNNTVQLAWTKLSTGASTYTIQRSGDGSSFATAGTVTSSSPGTQSFTWTDPSALPGVSYYRLKITDENIFNTYSPVVTVNGCATNSQKLVSDQATGSSTLVIQLQQNAAVDISLYDILGHKLEVSGLTGKRAMQQGLYQLPVTQHNVTPGMYLLSVTINGNKNTYRIVQP